MRRASRARAARGGPALTGRPRPRRRYAVDRAPSSAHERRCDPEQPRRLRTCPPPSQLNVPLHQRPRRPQPESPPRPSAGRPQRRASDNRDLRRPLDAAPSGRHEQSEHRTAAKCRQARSTVTGPVQRATQPSARPAHPVVAPPSTRRPGLAVSDVLTRTFPPVGKSVTAAHAAAREPVPLVPAELRTAAAAPVSHA